MLGPKLSWKPREKNRYRRQSSAFGAADDHLYLLEANRLFGSALRPNLEARARRRVLVNSWCSVSEGERKRLPLQSHKEGKQQMNLWHLYAPPCPPAGRAPLLQHRDRDTLCDCDTIGTPAMTAAKADTKASLGGDED